MQDAPRLKLHLAECAAGGLCLLAAPGRLAALRLKEDAGVEGVAYLGLLHGFLKLLDRHDKLALAGPGAMIKADWLGELDVFGMPMEVYEPDGNSSDHVAWLHRTVRTYAERLEPTSTLLDSEWVCKAEDGDNAVREIISTSYRG